MSLSDLSLVDSTADLPPQAASRLESAQASAHTAIALFVGTLIASPVLVAALAGRQDVVVALAMYLAAIVGSWVAVGLFAGAFALAGRKRARAQAEASADARDRTAAAASSAAPTDEGTDDDATEPDPVSATR